MKKIPRLASRDWIGLSLVLIGFVLRLRQYLANRSLWLDEAMLANNIVSRTFGELTGWLDYDQQAPIGFLWLQKTTTVIFGNNEYALRLIPFAAGCIALIFMFLLSRRLTAFSGNTALALFAVSSTLIYYTSEAKQYIVDVSVALGLLTIFLHHNERGWNPLDYIRFGVIGAVTIWFSHPSVFSLVGVGLLLLIKAIKQKSALDWTLLTGGFWLVSFAAFYFTLLRRSVNADVLLDYWGDAFLPLSADALNWLVVALNNFFVFSAGLETPLVLNSLLALGGLMLITRKNPSFAAALNFPFLFALFASAFHVYPFAGRMVIFAAPAFFLLIGAGLEIITLIRLPPVASRWVLSLLAVSLVVFNAQTPIQNFMDPLYREHIKPSMEYLRDFRKEGDIIYVYYWAEPAVRYYAPKYGMDMSEFIIGVNHHDNPMTYSADLESLRGHERVWVLFSHVYENGDFNERDFILRLLDSMGEQLRQFRVPGTSVYLYLYDLR